MIKIEKDSVDGIGRYRLLREGSMLCGLITETKDGRWRVEMFMKIDTVVETEGQAVAFARGASAALMAFKVFKESTIEPST